VELEWAIWLFDVLSFIKYLAFANALSVNPLNIFQNKCVYKTHVAVDFGTGDLYLKMDSGALSTQQERLVVTSLAGYDPSW
jgi:hypothetical protein